MRPPARLVFSDVDETLIDCKSMFDFLDFYLGERYGPQGVRRARAVRADLTAAASAGVPREQANRSYYRAWAGEPAELVGESGRRWFAERARGAGFYIAATRNALSGHRAAGDRLVLVSGSFPAVVEPIARDVGAAQALCSRPEVRAGVFTGELVGDPVIGEEKRRAVRAVLDAQPQVDPADCYGYGDHVSDLPMLGEVGHPVLVGAPELLGRLAGARLLPARRGPA
ncbi:HAD family hydrolase [Streptacidiphilus melanogenes]|uniref:HAD family hydrolase n=1 Tax=Streptacidiphilus melanogenes TaxID=411235 RepID=UPI0005A69BDA|nr:HAD-IB family hydrolase [Streptacidiphilus melanogenes]